MSWPKGKPRKGYKKKIKTSSRFESNSVGPIPQFKDEYIGHPDAEEVNKALNDSVMDYLSDPNADFIGQSSEEKNSNVYWRGIIGPPKPLEEVVNVMESQGYYFAKTSTGMKFWIDINAGTFKVLNNSNEAIIDFSKETEAL